MHVIRLLPLYSFVCWVGTTQREALIASQSVRHGVERNDAELVASTNIANVLRAPRHDRRRALDARQKCSWCVLVSWEESWVRSWRGAGGKWGSKWCDWLEFEGV
jgi:hypothetical protein